MKLINYDFLTKEQQKNEKGIILKNEDILHVVIDKVCDSEIVILCKNKDLSICNRKEYKTKKNMQKK